MTPSRAPPSPEQLALDLTSEPDDEDDGSFDYWVRQQLPKSPDQQPADTREDEP